MAKFTRQHNNVCINKLPRSQEDNQPYCCYQILVTESGIGQNYTVQCVECGQCEDCTEGWNV